MTWSEDINKVQAMFRTASGSRSPSSEAANAQMGADPNADVIAQMAANRRVNQKMAGAGSSVTLSTGRPTDPLFYWRNANLPYNIWEKGELEKVRAFTRLLYILHPIIGSCVDIFSKYPLTGMEVVCPKDSKIADFYSELFLDQLDYEDFLIDVGREYWTVGEAWPFGTFSELLGVWEADELLQPDDIKVIRSPFLLEPRYEMRLPEAIRKILRERKPQLEYNQLIQSFPEMASMPLGDVVSEDDQLAWMPVSNMLLSHLKFKGDTFHDRGVPILLRAFRSVMQEEMLNAAQEAIASRLYTPLILAKLGASATDLGTDVPWIPTQGDLDTFNDALNAALAADFRVMVHHFAVDMENVFGRENMPQLGDDFDRLTEKILQTFGLSKTMLSGGGSGETYAADALNRDLISQLLTTYQKRLRRFFKKRCEIVAEAQGHYDFDIKGGRPIPIMEEVVETDAETGEQRIIQRPKLLVPDLRIQAMNMRDEDQFRQFVEGLRATGVPISMRTRLTNVPIDLEDEEQAVIKEQVRQAVAAQETRKQTYIELKRKGLPIPEDLLADFQPRLPDPVASPAAPAEEQVLDTLGINDPAATDALTPTPEEMMAAEEAGTTGEDGQMSGAVVQMLPKNQIAPLLLDTGQSTRPPESDEQRASMPKAAALEHGDGAVVYAHDDLAEIVGMPAVRGPRTAGLRDVRAFYRRDELDPEEAPV